MNASLITSRSPGDKSAGFSLLEVLCAVLIVGVALVGLTQAITTALQSNKDSEVQASTALFAAGMIETLRAEGDFVNGTTEGKCGAGLSQFEWTQTIGPGGLEGLYEVAVVVRQVSSGKTICELKTLLFEMPINSGSGTGTQKTDQRSKSGSSNRSRRS